MDKGILRRTVSLGVKAEPIEWGAMFGSCNDEEQAEILDAAVAEMSSAGGTFGAEKQAVYLSKHIDRKGPTAQWLRALVAFIDGKSYSDPPARNPAATKKEKTDAE
jgi:hypothetical protein